uniref:Uncharacterized protein n=1 Tax=Panagrolaimus sp. JU765 TaxID=591449 RepID=A0AC34R4B2_9BILA
MLIYEDWNELYKCAKAIHQIETQMENTPKIVYKGEWSTKVQHILEQLRKSPPADHKKITTYSNVDEIIIIDRWLDPVTPLIQQQTFAGVADELYRIDIQSKIKFDTKIFYEGSDIPKEVKDKPQFDFYLNDEIYPTLRDSLMKDIGLKIRSHVKECKTEEDNFKSLGTIAEFGEFVNNSAKKLLLKKKVLGIYTRMTELFFSELSEPFRVSIRKCEEEIISGKYGDKPIPFIENAIIDATPLMPIVRLIALQSQICNGLKTPTWQYYRRLIVQV